MEDNAGFVLINAEKQKYGKSLLLPNIFSILGLAFVVIGFVKTPLQQEWSFGFRTVVFAAGLIIVYTSAHFGIKRNRESIYLRDKANDFIEIDSQLKKFTVSSYVNGEVKTRILWFDYIGEFKVDRKINSSYGKLTLVLHNIYKDVVYEDEVSIDYCFIDTAIEKLQPFMRR